MKNQDVTVGKVYEMRVSGNLVPVVILSERIATQRVHTRQYGNPDKFQRVTRYSARNLRTGVVLPRVSAARCRRRLIRFGRPVPFYDIPRHSLCKLDGTWGAVVKFHRIDGRFAVCSRLSSAAAEGTGRARVHYAADAIARTINPHPGEIAQETL